MAKYAQGKFSIKNPGKYVGNNTPLYRSSWEWHFMQFCDNHPGVIQWSSESLRIPYINPLTGKNSVYYPDFFVMYVDKNNKKHGEIIEIKPLKETSIAEAKSQRDKLSAVLNMAKWQACKAFCQVHGLQFRIVNEKDLFHNPAKRK